MPLHNTNTVAMAQLVFKVTVVVWSGEQLGLNHVVAAGLKGKRVEVHGSQTGVLLTRYSTGIKILTLKVQFVR